MNYGIIVETSIFFAKKYMIESLPWVELGNHPIQGKKTPSNIITNTEQSVKAIIDMLEIAHDQSQIERKNHITNFFAKSNGVINHLLRTGEITNPTQADELRHKVMKLLAIPEDTTYNTIKKLLNKNPNYESKLDISLQVILQHIATDGIKSSIRNRWTTLDKKYFKSDIRAFTEYAAIIQAYFFQKYGMELTKENAEKIKEK